jgi:hypothetical protein
MALRGICSLDEAVLRSEVSALLGVVEDAPTVRDLNSVGSCNTAPERPEAAGFEGFPADFSERNQAAGTT